jgi:hypothetical protein
MPINTHRGGGSFWRMNELHSVELKAELSVYTGMRRPAHVCATCSEHFTRKYSAKRHNLTIHNNGGEIVTYLEYLVGRNSGLYRPSHPSLYRKARGEKGIHNFVHGTVTADSMGDNFRPGVLQQQTPFQSIPTPPSVYQPQSQSPDASPYSTDRISHPVHTMNDQVTMLKIQELKSLMYKYPQCPALA